MAQSAPPDILSIEIVLSDGMTITLGPSNILSVEWRVDSNPRHTREIIHLTLNLVAQHSEFSLRPEQIRRLNVRTIDGDCSPRGNPRIGPG